MTGADFLSGDLGLMLETATSDQLGIERKVTITSNTMTIVADPTTKAEIQLSSSWMLASINFYLVKSEQGFSSQREREEKKRKSEQGFIFVFHVGAHTEVELEDQKLGIEDAKMPHLLPWMKE